MKRRKRRPGRWRRLWSSCRGWLGQVSANFIGGMLTVLALRWLGLG